MLPQCHHRFYTSTRYSTPWSKHWKFCLLASGEPIAEVSNSSPGRPLSLLVSVISFQSAANLALGNTVCRLCSPTMTSISAAEYLVSLHNLCSRTGCTLCRSSQNSTCTGPAAWRWDFITVLHLETFLFFHCSGNLWTPGGGKHASCRRLTAHCVHLCTNTRHLCRMHRMSVERRRSCITPPLWGGGFYSLKSRRGRCVDPTLPQYCMTWVWNELQSLNRAGNSFASLTGKNSHVNRNANLKPQLCLIRKALPRPLLCKLSWVWGAVIENSRMHAQVWLSGPDCSVEPACFSA